MKTFRNAALAVFAALVASTSFVSGDGAAKAETGEPSMKVQPNNHTKGNYMTPKLAFGKGGLPPLGEWRQPTSEASGASHPSRPRAWATTGNAEKSDLVITRVFDAPVELVWKAWTDPEYVMRWWGPTGFTSPTCRIDLREGGTFVFHMRAPKEFQGPQDLYLSGVYKKIVHLKLIEYSQGLSDKDGKRIDPTTMGMPPDFPKEIPSALALKRVGDKTELIVTEYGWAVGQMRDMSEAGMNQCLDKLAQTLAKR